MTDSNMSQLWPLFWDAAWETLYIVAITLTLAWCLAEPRGRFTRALDFPIVRWFGLISYSLYLWQPVFLWEKSPLSPGLGVVAAVVVAACSYYLVELPGLAMRNALPELVRTRWAALAGGGQTPAS